MDVIYSVGVSWEHQ